MIRMNIEEIADFLENLEEYLNSTENYGNEEIDEEINEEEIDDKVDEEIEIARKENLEVEDIELVTLIDKYVTKMSKKRTKKDKIDFEDNKKIDLVEKGGDILLKVYRNNDFKYVISKYKKLVEEKDEDLVKIIDEDVLTTELYNLMIKLRIIKYEDFYEILLKNYLNEGLLKDAVRERLKFLKSRKIYLENYVNELYQRINYFNDIRNVLNVISLNTEITEEDLKKIIEKTS